MVQEADVENLKKYHEALRVASAYEPRILKIPSMGDLEILTGAIGFITNGLSKVTEEGINANFDKKESFYFGFLKLELNGRMNGFFRRREPLEPLPTGQTDFHFA